MIFFKILFQPSNKFVPLYEQIMLENAIIGENGYSFGIQYSPQTYNDWLMKEEVFKVFVDSSVKQLIMSNYKFSALIERQNLFNLNLVDCKVKNIDIDELLEGEEFNSELLNVIVKENEEYEIMQVYFRSENQHMVTLKSNGVLGVDGDLTENEIDDIKRLIDFLGLGPLVLV